MIVPPVIVPMTLLLFPVAVAVTDPGGLIGAEACAGGAGVTDLDSCKKWLTIAHPSPAAPTMEPKI